MGLLKKKTPQASEEKKEGHIIRLCPRCKKPMPRPASNVSGWFAPVEYVCYHCGYTGKFFVEVDPNEVDLQQLDEITEGKRHFGEIEPEDENKGELVEEEEIEQEIRGSDKKVGQVIHLCPKCKKPMPLPADFGYWLGPKKFHCDNCGYSGHSYIEVYPNAIDPQKLEEIIEGKRQLDEFLSEDAEKKEDEEED